MGKALDREFLMARRGIKPIREDRSEGRVIACTYEVPKSWIKISPPRRVSEEQRETARARMTEIQRKRRVNGQTENGF